VLLVSAHAPYRETVRQLLELEGDLTVVGEAATVAAALALAPEVRAEVVLTELPLPDGDGLALARALRTSAPPVAVLLLTLFDDEVVAARAARAGVRAVLAKTAPARELVAAVRGAGRPARAAVPPVPVAPAVLARPPAPPPAGARRAGRPRPGSPVTAGLLYWVLAVGSVGVGALQAVLGLAPLGLAYGLLGALYWVTGAWLLQGDRRGYTWGLASGVLAAWVPLAQALAESSALLPLVTLYLGAALILWERRAAFGARVGLG
jgi:CheY-like chemotaxis protein